MRHEVNMGYDGALNSGFSRAADLECGAVVTLDADGQHDPLLLERFIAALDQGAAVVVGVRDRFQRLAERVFAWVARARWKINDPLCGMKGYKMEVYRELGHFDSYGSIGTELAIFASLRGFAITQIPVRTRERVGQSRFGQRIRGNWRILRALLIAVAQVAQLGAEGDVADGMFSSTPPRLNLRTRVARQSRSGSLAILHCSKRRSGSISEPFARARVGGFVAWEVLDYEPAAVKNDRTRMTQFPAIDYRTHPAYSTSEVDYKYDDQLIAGCVARVDRAFSDFRSLPLPTLADAAQVVSDINLCAQEILRHARAVDAPIVAREWLGASIEWAVAAIHYECVRLVFLDRQYDGSRLANAQRAQLQTLRTDGMYIADVDDRDFRAVQGLALRFAPELQRKVSEHPAGRAVYGPSRVSPLGRAIQRLLANAGVLDVVSNFKRTRMAVMGTGLEYSGPEQAWHAGLYSDVGLADSPLKYFHVDQADHLPKAMIYATPVTSDTGPTGIIRTSNTWKRSEFLFRAYKGLDVVTIGRYGKYVDGAEYRAPARSPELRRIFMQLPTAFQGSSHFGDDLLPESPIAQQLLAQEETFLSTDRGQVLVFDGGRTLHRGSLVRRGERVAMQVAFKNLNDRRVRNQLDGGSAFSKLLRRMGRLAMLSVRG